MSLGFDEYEMRDVSPRGRRILDEMTQTEWENLWKKLRFYTYKNFGYKVKGRFNLDEVIQEAIEDTYFGNRRLPPDINLTAFLCETVRSKISHILEKERNKISIEEIKGAQQQTSLATLRENALEYPQLIYRHDEGYQRVMYEELCSQIRRSVQSDSCLIRLVELLFVVPDLKPREIAIQMNQPIKTVLNLLRRLNRRARKIGVRKSNDYVEEK
jgi:DNA-directed RNA polymerase specialized sigma24 family protein